MNCSVNPAVKGAINPSVKGSVNPSVNGFCNPSVYPWGSDVKGAKATYPLSPRILGYSYRFECLTEGLIEGLTEGLTDASPYSLSTKVEERGRGFFHGGGHSRENHHLDPRFDRLKGGSSETTAAVLDRRASTLPVASRRRRSAPR